MKVVRIQGDLKVGTTYAYVTNGYVLGVYNGSVMSTCNCRNCHGTDPEIFRFSNGNHGKMIFDVGLVEVENGISSVTK
jgi:hypothetical protein